MRRAQRDDVLRVGEVVPRAYGKYLDRMDRVPAPVARDYSDAIARGLVWVCGEPIHSVVSLAEDDGGLLIENAAVLPEIQGQGMGRCLMQFAEQEAQRRGFDLVRLYTNEVMTENISVYSRLGYREVRRSVEDGYRRVFFEKSL